MRPYAERHHGTLRFSLLNAFMPNEVLRQEKIVHHQRKSEKQKEAQRKEWSLKIRVIKEHGLHAGKKWSSYVPQGPIWSVATGALEEIAVDDSILIAAHFVPEMLGGKLFKGIFGESIRTSDVLGAKNALLLPAPVACALDESAITVVPDYPEKPTLQEQADWIAVQVSRHGSWKQILAASNISETRGDQDW